MTSEQLIHYTPYLHILYSIITGVLLLCIIIRSNKIYSKTLNPQMVFIGAGFLIAIFSDIIHVTNSLLYTYNPIETYAITDSLFIIIRDFFMSFSLFATIFQINAIKEPRANEFRNNIYLRYLKIFGAISIALFTWRYFSPYEFVYTIDTHIISNPIIEVIGNIFYTITSIIYMNINRSQNKKMVSAFTLGLLIVGIGELHLIDFIRPQALTHLITHISIILGLYLIYRGINELKAPSNLFSLREKIILFPPLYLIVLFLLFSTTSIIFFDIKYTPTFQYLFLSIFLIAIISSYIISKKITKPITEAIKQLQQIKPKNKPQYITTTSNDEIGMLIKEINIKSKSNWQYNQELIEKNQREILLRKLIEKVRNAQDINRVKYDLITNIGKFFNVDRVYIAEYDNENQKFLKIEKYAEFRSSSDIPSIAQASIDDEILKSIYDEIQQGTEIFCKDINNCILQNKQTNNLPNLFQGLKSTYNIPISYAKKLYGFIGLDYKQETPLSIDDLNFFRTLSYQIGSAYHQKDLYAQAKKNAQREAVLRKFIETIRSTINIDESINIICEDTAKLFGTERASIVKIPNMQDINTYNVINEYKLNNSIKGLNELPFESKNEIVLFGLKEMFSEKELFNITNTKKENYPESYRSSMQNIGIKSQLGVPIKKEGDIWGVIVISSYQTYRNWNDDEIQLLKSIAAQVYIALKQAELFATIQEQNKKEKLTRTIIDSTRSSLDANKVKSEIIKAVGTSLKADRCYIIEFNKEQQKFQPVDREYLSSDDIPSLIDFDFENQIPEFSQRAKNREDIILYDREEFFEQNLITEDTYNNLKKRNIVSGFSVPITYFDDLLGILVINNTQKNRAFSEIDIQFVRYIAAQAGIALYQAMLYETIKQTAEKESILREIISEIKPSQNIEQIYKHILIKLSCIFNSNRTMFLNPPSHKNGDAKIKYEYLKDEKMPSLKDALFSKELYKDLTKYTNLIKPIVINNTKDFEKNNSNIQNFFNQNFIRAALIVPMTKQNKDTQLLGFLIVCKSYTTEWSDYQVGLIKSIADSLVTIVWELSKLIEISKLKETFIATLAHDLQVPLISEQKTLEFILKKPTTEPLKNFKDVLEEILHNNELLIEQLKKILNSYYYEQGKKTLLTQKTSINSCINTTLNTLKERVNEKNITLSLKTDENLPEVNIDKEEITTAIFNIMENAIEYTQREGNVSIESYQEEDSIIIKVSDNGPGIPLELQSRLFKRYEMAVTIERKIGSGLGLYLTKQIIDAHNGSISFISKPGETIFYISLPIER